MTLEQQVCSLEMAKKLKELGVKQESLFNYYWQDRQFGGKYILRFSRGSKSREYISAFTVAELGDFFDSKLTIYKGHVEWHCRYWWGVEPNPLRFNVTEWHEAGDKNLANALAKMLIYLIENKLIKI